MGGIAAFASVYGLFQYAGSICLVPAAVSLAGLWVLARAGRGGVGPRYFAGAIAVTLGQVAWFAVGVVLSGGGWMLAAEAVLLAALAGWLWWRPGLAAVIAFALVQGTAAAANAVLLAATAPGSFEHRGLAVHLALRLLAVILVAAGYRALRRGRAGAAPPPPSLSASA